MGYNGEKFILTVVDGLQIFGIFLELIFKSFLLSHIDDNAPGANTLLIYDNGNRMD